MKNKQNRQNFSETYQEKNTERIQINKINNNKRYINILQLVPQKFKISEKTTVNVRRDPEKWNYLLEGRPLVVQASPARSVS